MPYFIAVSRDLSIRVFEFINLLHSVYYFFRVPDTQGLAGTGRNQDAVLVSPAYIPHIFLNLISVYTAQYTECGLISITCFEAIKIVNIQMALFTELR